MDHERAVAAITHWARQDGNIRAVLLTGSVAVDGAADALSDLDIELYATDPQALLQSSSWYHQFGDVLVVEALPNPGWHPTRLVYYSGAKIDFAIAGVDSCTHSRHDRPVRILVDKDGLTADLEQLQSAGTPPPVEDVEQCIHWFYAAALMEAKLLVRRELWQAKFREWDLMRQLLRMVEWDHRSRYGWDYDTWYNGKRIAQWADADLRESAEGLWAPYETTAMTAALLRAVDLFAPLAESVGSAVELPPFDHGRVTAEVRRLLALGNASKSLGGG